jgi:hypothetical protein
VTKRLLSGGSDYRFDKRNFCFSLGALHGRGGATEELTTPSNRQRIHLLDQRPDRVVMTVEAFNE